MRYSIAPRSRCPEKLSFHLVSEAHKIKEFYSENTANAKKSNIFVSFPLAISMKLVVSLLFVFSLSAFQAQIGTGQWRLHVAPKGIDIAAGGGLVFAAMETGLLEYDPAAKEVSLWTDVNALSDLSVSCVHFDSYSGSFFVGYANGNIDRIKDNVVTNIPAVKLANLQGSKRINRFVTVGQYVYTATDFGIVVINAASDEVKDTYYPSANLDPIVDVAVFNDSIYALTPVNLLKSNLSNPILADVSQWKTDARAPQQTVNVYDHLFVYSDALHLVMKTPEYGNDNIYEITDSGPTAKLSLPFTLEIQGLEVVDNALYLSVYDGLIILNQQFEIAQVVNSYPFNPASRARNATNLDGTIYIADELSGLVSVGSEGTKKLAVPGPPKNNFFAISGAKDKLSVAGGIINKSVLTYSRAGAYTFQDEDWKLFDANNQAMIDDNRVWDIGATAVNPNNTTQVAIGGYCYDPLLISDDGSTITTLYNETNSELEKTTLGNGFICITDLKYDSKGNLWVLNGYANKPLKVLTKAGAWHSFDAGVNSKTRYSGRMAVDQEFNKWFAIYDQGLFGYDDGGTLEDPTDDRYIQLKEGVNTGGLPSNNVTALAVDFDNELWIGTTSGFAILYNSSSVFGAAPGDYDAQRIKIDYEGNVEYLLGNTSITDIEVDGGNRKWIGTANAGIFLLSADGLEIIQSFTTENSPLISNNIIDMQFQEKTGELFIITDNGLVSYRSDASTGDSDYSDVKVFPNPVKPEFNGVITIQGIKYDSDVKFTDVAGNVVYQTTSNGGTATWNGLTLTGEKVPSGVYLIWTASNTEKGRKVGKVLILN